MRDLYFRLGIYPTAPEEEIRKAISKCDSVALKADAAAVLLVAARRQSYDRVHETLHNIGTLRANLGLTYGESWIRLESDDFSKHPTYTDSMYDTLVTKLHQVNKKAKINRFTDSIKGFFYGIFRVAAIVTSIAALIWIGSTWESSSSSSQTTTGEHNTSTQSEFNEPKLPLPFSGKVRRFTSQPGVAPLEIKTDSNSHYLVKLEDVTTGKDILDVFVRGGSAVEIDVPFGNYRMKYASGQIWYGYDHYFGPHPLTNYSKAESTFRFYSDGSSIKGYTVTLYRVLDGNLRTSQIGPNQF
ncbi:hypothetical protein [Desulfovermiculus halophilus]|uniref:hypothetical protein n=1 Tax=Desulfovermiculus halophilus TaxID=339722 RepID=UPI0012946E1C|nr:hypothetical protein [Desulfovermiculus halophilus]